MRSVLVVFVLVFSLGFAGCTDSGPWDIGDALPACPNVVGPSPPEPAIISFSGNNDTVTPMFNLAPFACPTAILLLLRPMMQGCLK